MIIHKDLYERYSTDKNGIIAIGYFDALHIGHRHLLQKLVEIANKKHLNSFVLTYANLPKKNLNNKNILDLNRKISEIKNLGIKNLIICNYDERFYSLPPSEFLNILKSNYNINSFVIGKDFSFGKNKSGDIQTLLSNGFEINIVEPVMYNNEYLSTSIIRQNILEGKIEVANQLLGYNFSIDGIVKKGKQLGRKLGFPTMNIHNEKIIYPKDGSYASVTHIKDKKYYSMTYVSKDIIETHLFNYEDFHYNFKIKVDFFRKIRDNQSFVNQESLKSQLSYDLIMVKEYFNL